jgi:uncharacterized membrane protein
MQCPACSTENPAGATFCQHCGASLSSAPPPPPGGYTQVPQPATGPAAAGYVPAQSGLSDNSAAAIAYITIIPAIIFLVMEPYNRKPFVRYHAVQCLGLNAAIFVLSIGFSILGMIHLGILLILLWPILWIGSVIVWILCIVSAAQGKWFKLPIIGDFARKQAGA